MIDWDTLVQNESEKILNYVNKILGDLDNSKDIVQDAFIACYRNIGNIDEDYLLSWLYKTAHNKAINFLKKNKRFKFGSIPDLVDRVDIEADTKKERLNKYIKEVFCTLKPKHALVLDLQFYQKKSYKEISEITGLTIPAIETILVRAKKECKKKLQGFKDLGVL